MDEFCSFLSDNNVNPVNTPTEITDLDNGGTFFIGPIIGGYTNTDIAKTIRTLVKEGDIEDGYLAISWL